MCSAIYATHVQTQIMKLSAFQSFVVLSFVRLFSTMGLPLCVWILKWGSRRNALCPAQKDGIIYNQRSYSGRTLNRHSFTNIEPCPISNQCASFILTCCCRSKGVARFIGGAFGTVRVVRERRGVCGIVCYASMKNLLFFFLYFMG